MTPEHDVTGQQLGEEREGGIETEKLSHLTKKKKQKRGRQSFEGENSPNHVVSPLVLGPKRSRSHWYINMCRLRSTSTAVLILTPTNTLPVPDYFLSPRTTEYLLPRRSTSYIFITSHVKTINSSLPLAPPPPSLSPPRPSPLVSALVSHPSLSPEQSRTLTVISHLGKLETPQSVCHTV